jgi:hypothetical protein
MTRRELLQVAAFAAAAGTGAVAGPSEGGPEWFRSARILIAEGYNPPFFPELTYDSARALMIARRLNAAGIRFPAAAYRAFFPTATRYPHHPELNGRDLLGETVEAFHQAGLKTVVYIPFNHPFMSTDALRPEYEDWCRRYADGRPIVTNHYGYGEFYEGCLNSPLLGEITEMIREVVSRYSVDLVYFDGPYQGMQHRQDFCHCRYCEEAYRKARNRPVPRQERPVPLEEEVEYREWLRDELVTGTMRRAREMIHGIRDVPVFYNDTGLLGRRECRSRVYSVVDGFMFEHAETSEQKLFNLQLGQSTGKCIWTYVGSHTIYNAQHLADNSMRSWFSYPLESQELLLDGSVAIAAGAGLKYWGLSRFYQMPRDPLEYESGRYVRELFDLAQRYETVLWGARPVYHAGILVGSQTIDWYAGKIWVPGAYPNAYYGAHQVFKDLGYDAEPFLDYQTTAERLARYALVFAPNAICLSAGQCEALREYVRNGGTLIATHLTSAADEYGRPAGNFQLSDLFQARLKQPEPIESPDLYLRKPPSGELVPQDPQVALWERTGDAELLAETYDLGRRRVVGPAALRRRFGKGTVIYIGSSLETVYGEGRIREAREYLQALIDPALAPLRTYELERRAGLTAQFAAGERDLLLHLLANTGNKVNKTSSREEFVPVEGISARIRLPQVGGTPRPVKAVTLLRAGRTQPYRIRDGWVELTVPRVLIHEVVRVELV